MLHHLLNDKIFIHSCDSLIRYSTVDLNKKITNSDAVVLTTRPNNAHLKNISSYGWVKISKDKIKKITCKKKASLKPNKDYVIIGSFAFKNKKIFTNTIKSCLLYTSPSPRDRTRSRMPSSA